jgi:hypothetical protein
MGLTIEQDYLERAMGNRVKAAEAMARDLMRGDPTTFKAGYTAENAALAVRDVFELSTREDDDVRFKLGLARSGRLCGECYADILGNDPHELSCSLNVPGNVHYAVAVYETDRCYGGPEEGGWYYTDGPLIEVNSFSLEVDEASGRCWDLNQTFRDEDRDEARRIASVVQIPRLELAPELKAQACHGDGEFSPGDYVVRWDIPTDYLDDRRPHYC